MPDSSKLDLSVLIVSFNTRELTLRCLDSLERACEGRDCEILVVDNASTDESVAAIRRAHPGVQLFVQDENLGFGRANLVAAQAARGDYLLLLNPDTEVGPATIDEVLDFVRRQGPETIVGGRTLDADGTLNPDSVWRAPSLWSAFCLGSGLTSAFRRSRLFDPESMGGWERDTVREVDIVSGCFLAISRGLWDRLGGFDPDFFMYGEDFDLCLRARALGARCMIDPAATIVHHGGASEAVRSGKMVRLFRARAQLYRKHWSVPGARFGILMLDLWSLTRMVAHRGLAWVRPRYRPGYEVWREIWGAREEWRRA